MRFSSFFLAPVFLVAASYASAQCELQKVLASSSVDNSDDALGSSIAVEGDTLLVGAPGHGPGSQRRGAVFAFERTPSGWNQTQKITVQDAVNGHALGGSIALEGDRVLIGNAGDDAGPMNSGSVRVFERQGTEWNEVQELRPSDPVAAHFFGRRVDMSGDYAVMPTRDDDDAGNQAGSAYVFQRTLSGWVELDELTGDDTVAGDLFGASAAIDGTTLFVGASHDDDNGFSSGSVYVFSRTGTEWSQVQKLTASDGQPSDHFGWSVEVRGNLALVGALFGDGNVQSSGAVYVFERTGSTWSETAKLTASDGSNSDWFCNSLAIDSNRALIGAPQVLGGPAGAAYLFERSGSEWTQVAKLTASDAEPNDDFGWAVELAVDEILVGAVADDDQDFCSGAVYSFELSPSVTPFCFCSDSAPCGNTDALSGCANSSGSGALLTACGTTSVTSDDLVLTATDLSPNQFAVMFMGGGQTQSFLGDGLRCTSGGALGQYRYPILATGPTGTNTIGPGIVEFSHENFGVLGQIASGQTWSFQCWYRNPFGPCGANFNLSNGVQVLFQP